MRYHGKIPSYRWRNEGMVPGFQTVSMSRRLEGHDPTHGCSREEQKHYAML